MRGKSVFYPMGWDDNGLPTERRVQNYFGVRCDPSLPYDADFTPPEKPDPKRQVPISRPNFVELCEQLVEEDEQVFEPLWRTLGLSVDWNAELHDDRRRSPGRSASARSCATSPAARPTSRRRRPSGTSPSRPPSPRPSSRPATTPAHYHRVAFHRPDGSRGPHRDHPARADPERRGADRAPRRRALPADLFGTTVTSPVFGVEIPVLAHPAAEPDKGAGIAMCCTFGDLTDVTWWRELQLPVRTLIGRDGRLSRETPDWLSAEPAAAAYERAQGQDRLLAPARRWSACCASPATSTASRRPTQRMANFYEKGDKPLEIVATRQWYIRNGGRDAEPARARCSSAAPRSRGSRPTCGTATTTGSAASTATG